MNYESLRLIISYYAINVNNSKISVGKIGYCLFVSPLFSFPPKTKKVKAIPETGAKQLSH